MMTISLFVLTMTHWSSDTFWPYFTLRRPAMLGIDATEATTNVGRKRMPNHTLAPVANASGTEASASQMA